MTPQRRLKQHANYTDNLTMPFKIADPATMKTDPRTMEEIIEEAEKIIARNVFIPKPRLPRLG